VEHSNAKARKTNETKDLGTRGKKTASPLATVRSNVRFRTPTDQNFAKGAEVDKQTWPKQNTENVTVGR
jgi:hypothetical protein